MKDVKLAMSPNLDLLRAVAVSSVFFAHLFEVVTRQSNHTSHHVGQLGVILFFVHTSLVLMQALGRSSLTGSALFREFFIHRAFRIYPLSIVCVSIAFLVPGHNWSLVEVASNLSLTMNLTYSRSMVGGLWTLPLEVQMYLALPVLFLLLRKRPLQWTVLAGLLIILLALMQPYISRRFSVIEYAPCFFGGILAWRPRPAAKMPGWAFPVALIAATLPWMLTPGNSMIPRWITCIALGLAIPHFREIANEGINALTKAIAKYSYGIYLTHAAALTVAFGTLADQPMVLQWAAFVVMAFALPLAAFHWIESPMMRYGKSLTAKPTPVATPEVFAKAA